jgi:hypothetical protein
MLLILIHNLGWRRKDLKNLVLKIITLIGQRDLVKLQNLPITNHRIGRAGRKNRKLVNNLVLRISQNHQKRIKQIFQTLRIRLQLKENIIQMNNIFEVAWKVLLWQQKIQIQMLRIHNKGKVERPIGHKFMVIQTKEIGWRTTMDILVLKIMEGDWGKEWHSVIPRSTTLSEH